MALRLHFLHFPETLISLTLFGVLTNCWSCMNIIFTQLITQLCAVCSLLFSCFAHHLLPVSCITSPFSWNSDICIQWVVWLCVLLFCIQAVQSSLLLDTNIRDFYPFAGMFNSFIWHTWCKLQTPLYYKLWRRSSR